MNQEDIRSLLRREDIGTFLQSRGYVSCQALEVGTYKGDFARHLATTWPRATIHTCDPWRHYPEYLDGCTMDWANNKAPANLEAFREEAMQKLSGLPNAQVHRMTGLECLSQFPNNSLALVYLDGNHSYGAVRPELQLGWAKTETGGVLGGHDLYSRHDHEQVCDVWRAVWEFAHEVNIRPHVTHCTSFWFVKP